MGATVTGVDAVEKNITIARLHAVCIIYHQAQTLMLMFSQISKHLLEATFDLILLLVSDMKCFIAIYT